VITAGKRYAEHQSSIKQSKEK